MAKPEELETKQERTEKLSKKSTRKNMLLRSPSPEKFSPNLQSKSPEPSVTLSSQFLLEQDTPRQRKPVNHWRFSVEEHRSREKKHDFGVPRKKQKLDQTTRENDTAEKMEVEDSCISDEQYDYIIACLPSSKSRFPKVLLNEFLSHF